MKCMISAIGGRSAVEMWFSAIWQHFSNHRGAEREMEWRVTGPPPEKDMNLSKSTQEHFVCGMKDSQAHAVVRKNLTMMRLAAAGTRHSWVQSRISSTSECCQRDARFLTNFEACNPRAQEQVSGSRSAVDIANTPKTWFPKSEFFPIFWCSLQISNFPNRSECARSARMGAKQKPAGCSGGQFRKLRNFP